MKVQVKKRSHILHGDKWLVSVLCECAWAASLRKDSRMSKKYWSMVSRMGKKKALLALAHTLLKVCYKLLSTREMYKEQEDEYLAKKDYEREKRLIRQLQAKGYVVERA